MANVWIGLIRDVDTGEWNWLRGNSSFRNWALGGEEFCAQISSTVQKRRGSELRADGTEWEMA